MPRVVVTGLGLVTPLGTDVEDVWTRLLDGEVGVTAPRRHGAAKPPTIAVGEIPPDVIERLKERHPDAAATGELRTLFGVAAGADAIAAAGLEPGAHARAGAILGAGPGAHRPEDIVRHLDADGHFDPVGYARATASIHPASLVRAAAEQPATLLARRYGLGGPVHAVTTACSAANQALGLAFRVVQRGEADWIVAGGSDSQVNPLGLVFFVLLGASASGDVEPSAACRPFDRRRSGLVMGEGAGCVVLESLDHARARGADIIAEVAGYGASMDAWRTTAPCRDGRGAAEAMAAALDDGGLAAQDIDFVNAHGTATKRNDPAEVLAIHTVFGEHAGALAVSSGKGALGHLLSGAAGVAFVASALAVQRDAVPPTANLDEPDTRCDLDFVPRVGRLQPVRAALTNSFAFGGQNACVALKKYAEGDA